MRVVALVVCAAALAGCTDVAPTPEVVSKVGDAPADYREQALSYLKGTLFDPYSVRDAELSAPFLKPGWTIDDLGPGWIVCFNANAKNRMGGYIGKKPMMLRFRGGKIVDSNSNDPISSTYCAEAIYAPFPEIEAKT